jgi:hypothetical protein
MTNATQLSTARKVVVAVCLGFFVVLVCGIGLFLLREDWRVWRTFRPTMATITQSEVESRYFVRGANHNVRVRFMYRVGAREYESGRYRIGEVAELGGRRAAERLVAQLPPGSTHAAWYDPAEPSVAVLRRGLNWGGLIVLGLGVGVPLLILVAVRLADRKAVRSASHETAAGN